MTAKSIFERGNPMNSASPYRFLNALRRVLLLAIVASLVWMSGLSSNSAWAVHKTAAFKGAELERNAPAAVEGDRLSAVIACLPKDLSQPNLKRALSEMGNDQLERVFHLKDAPKLSQAEAGLASCLSLQGL
jgi:hypothetical protein